MPITTTLVTEKNFDSYDLFAAITKDSIADIFSDPNSDAVASINAHLQAGWSLLDAVRDEISASVNFANDDVAKDWCRFVDADDADEATAAYAQTWLRDNVMDNHHTCKELIHACAEVATSKTFTRAGLNKTACRMLHDRIAKSWWHYDQPIGNFGSAFTRNLRQTELLYKKMMANPTWAMRKFGEDLFYISKYQWLQFQRFFCLMNIDSAKEKLRADLTAARASGRLDEIKTKYGAIRLSSVDFTPVFSCTEVLQPAKTVENALLYRSLLRACYSNKALYGGIDADELSAFAYLYGDTNFSYTEIQKKLNDSVELKQIADNIKRPSRWAFGLLDMGAIDRISAEFGIDVKSAEEFLLSHQYVKDDLRIEIPHDAEEAILRAMLQDAWEAWTHSGSILLSAYNANLDARAHDEILMRSETALYEHWRPSVRIMKAVIAADTGEYSVFDLSGEELEKAFTKSLAHLYCAYAHYPGLPMHFGDTEFPKWLDADYLNKAADELKTMHERNQKLADAIVLPANQ